MVYYQVNSRQHHSRANRLVTRTFRLVSVPMSLRKWPHRSHLKYPRWYSLQLYSFFWTKRSSKVSRRGHCLESSFSFDGYAALAWSRCISCTHYIALDRWLWVLNAELCVYSSKQLVSKFCHSNPRIPTQIKRVIVFAFLDFRAGRIRLADWREWYTRWVLFL